MKYLLCLLTFLFLTNGSHAQELFPTLEKNIIDYFTMNGGGYETLDGIIKKLKKDPKASDMVTIEVYQKISPNEPLIDDYIKSIRNDGSWGDINYSDNSPSGWQPSVHAQRILLLTTLYVKPNTKYYKNPEVNVVLHKALKFWFDKKLVCVNWWYNQIGIPKTLGPAFIMFRSEFSESELNGALEVLNNSGFVQTGQNKVWQAGNMMYKSILLKDMALAQRARDTIFSELKISKEEGVKADFSFQQHGAQQQFGNYGLSFANTQSFWARVFSKTTLAVDNGKLEVLKNLLVGGFNWTSWKGSFDVNSLGRQFFKGVQKSKSLAIAYSMVDMMLVDPIHKSDYLAFILRNYSQNEHPLLVGTKHFWRSDMTVHRAPSWFSSIKMSSDRIQATEAMNNENLKGYYMGSGTTFVYVDGNEYNDIFPYWNWNKLPGVTNYKNKNPLPVLTGKGYRNKGDFTGGVTTGANGITAFKLYRDSLHANKSWFYLDNQLICLGANIHGDKNLPVSTTINQNNLNGKVYFFDKKVKHLKAGSTTSSEILKWVHHNKIGYYFLSPTKSTVSSKKQSGNWGEITSLYSGDQNISKPVFTLEIEHGTLTKNSNYAYVMLPNISISQLKNYNPNFKVIANNESAQIISKKNQSITMLAIYRPTTVRISNMPVLQFYQPGLYIVEKKLKYWELSLSDPTQKLDSINLLFGGNAVSIHMPKDENKGNTISLKLKIDK